MKKTKELEKHITGENGISYTLGEDGFYYPDLKLPEGTHYNIGKYGLMRWEYLKVHRRGEYFKLLLAGELSQMGIWPSRHSSNIHASMAVFLIARGNKHLHEVDEECYERMELLAGRMKAGTGITEELKSADFMQWIGLVNNVRNAAEEIVLKELVYR